MASFITPVRRWNDVSICNTSKVISNFGSSVMLPLTVENILAIVALATFEVNLNLSDNYVAKILAFPMTL